MMIYLFPVVFVQIYPENAVGKQGNKTVEVTTQLLAVTAKS